MYLIETVEKEALMDKKSMFRQMAQFSSVPVDESADFCELWGSSFKDGGSDFCEYRFFKNAKQFANYRVQGY